MSATEDGGSVAVTGLSIADVDATLAPAGVYSVTLSASQGTLTLSTTTGLTFDTGDGSADATMTFHGTLSDINTAVATATYAPNANFNGSDTIVFAVTDTFGGIVATGTGLATSDSDNVAVTVSAVNDPVTSNAPATATVDEDVATPIAGLSISDVDATLAPAGVYEVTLAATNGTLTLTTLTGLTFTAGDGTADGTMTFHGTLSNINNALATASYKGASNFNGPAQISINVTDTFGGIVATGTGLATSDSDTINVTVTAVNDAPDAVLGTDPYAATEQTTLDLKNTGMSVSDLDAGGADVTVTLSVTEGALSVTAGTSGVTNVSGSGTSSVTITGSIAAINALLNTDGTSTVSYFDNTDTPSATATLSLQVNDGGNTGTGPVGSDTDTSTINISAVNDAPNATITPTSYSGIPNNAVNLKNNGLSVSDVDGLGGSETVTLSVSSGTLTVTTGGSGAGVAGSGTSSVTITGSIAQINALLNTDGTSTVSFVDTTGGSKTLTLAINDNGFTGAPPPNPLTAQDTADINLGEPPVVDLNGGGAGTGATLGYTENDAATAIAPAGITTDLDSPNYNGGSLTVHFSANGAAEDQLSILTDATVTVSSGTVSVGGLAIGTVSGGTNGADLVISFNTTDATQSAVSTLIEHIAYANASDNPSTAARTASFTINDGTGATGSADATISITPANDAPVATITPVSYSATENVALSLKNNGLAVSDIDGNAGSETVTLSVGEGTLNVTAGGSGAVVTNSGTASVTITGTLAQINALLNTDGTSTVSYTDGNDNPAASTTLTLAIDDNGNTGGGNLSANDTATINITPTNDAPVATITPVSYSATENVALSLKNNGLAVSDIDGNAGSETVTLSVGEGTLNVTAGGSGAVVNNSGTASVTITGTLAQINALLNTDGTSTVSYTETIDNPAASTTLTLQIDDNGNTGGGNLTANDTATINITPANDAPVATITPASYSATEQTALSLKNSGLSVSDVDGNAGSETVTLSVTEGVLNVTAGGSGAVVNNSGTASVTITGTIAQINALLNTDGTSTLSYTNNLDDPSASATLTLLIHDNGNTGGGDLSANDTATINIAPVNDAPGLSNVPATADYTENAAPVLFSAPFPNQIIITDPDPFPHGAPGGNGLILVATAKIASGFVTGDRLLVDDTSDAPGPQTSGFYTGINVQWDYDATTHILSLFSADAPTNSGDTMVDFDHVLDNVYFDSTSDDPTNGGANTTRTIEWQVQDKGGTANGGTDLSAVYTTTLTVHALNDAPVAAIAPASYSATEGVSLSLKNNGLSVTDVDGGGGSQTVTLSVGEGVLNVTAGGSGAGVAGSGTNSVTITGSAAQINALLNTDGTSTVAYVDNNDVPSASTTLTLLVHDNGNTGAGGDLSSSDAATINITPVDDPPALTGFGDASSFTENGSSVLLDTNGNASVSDPELAVSPNNYEGATLTVARAGGPNADDSFGATGSLDLVDVSGTGENVSLDGGATFIGTFVDNGDGSIQFTFNANATAADINSVVRQIVYANVSDNPPTSVQVDFTFNDGNGQPSGQPQGTGPGTTVGSFTVNITQVDDAPVLLNVAQGAAYGIGSPGVVLSSTLGVFDIDATPPSTLTGIASATIKIESGFFAGDQLFVNLPTSGGFFIVDDGGGPVVTNISVASNALGQLVLTGTDTTLHYQLVLDAVNYHSTAADPSNGGANPTRTISWVVNDGALNSQTPNLDPDNLVNATILHFDVPPALDLDASGAGTGFTTTFTENGSAIAIVDTDVSITDPDNATVDSATIVLTNAKAGDVLSVAGAPPFGIDASVDTSVAGKITLTLSNSASLADYQTALGQVRFSNSGENPDTTDRDLTVQLAGGESSSNTAHATVHVVGVNDAPVNTVPGAQSAIPNTNKTIAGLAVSDPDAASGSLTTTLSVLHGILTVSSAGGAGVSGSGTASVTLTGTLAQINTTLSASNNVVYKSDAAFNGSDTLNVLTNDGGNTGTGGAQSDTDNVTIIVSAPPTITSNGGGDTATVNVLERTSAVTTVVATDPDSPSLTYSIVGGSDSAKFQINGSTGALSFVTAPNFDVPKDADHNNSYIVQVRVSDGVLSDDQTLTVQVTDDPSITSKVHWMKSVDPGAHPAGWTPAGLGDFNADGTTDLAWFNSTTGNLDIWKLSNGAWTASSNVGSHPGGYQPVGFGDYNNDGTGDVLWYNPTTRNVDLWKISDGQWAGSVNIGTHPAGSQPALSGDFNGDGTSDLLWYNPTTNGVDIWKISNGQWAGSVDVGPHPAGYQPVLSGDFNGDGTSDILWYNPTNGQADIWNMSNGQWSGSVAVGAHPLGWQPLGAADFNLDGTTDIAWHNPTTNNIDIWLIENSHWSESVNIGSHPPGTTERGSVFPTPLQPVVAVGVGDFDHNGVADIMWQDTGNKHIDNWLLDYS
ncbi:MAG: FG-GAP-like repeat-containing protein [Xanthobacteraceae bacterium]